MMDVSSDENQETLRQYSVSKSAKTIKKISKSIKKKMKAFRPYQRSWHLALELFGDGI